MAPKELTKHQLSSRLAYEQKIPAFLQRLQNRAAGIPDDDEDPEFEDDGSGRPPIPRRPAIPERPEGEEGSENEDDDDEKPQVVVLREGKHLSAREAENERRREKGLPPIPDPESLPHSSEASSALSKPEPKAKEETKSLSFSSTSKSGSKSSTLKRKAGSLTGKKQESEQGKASGSKPHARKKAKKNEKTLLSFGDEM